MTLSANQLAQFHIMYIVTYFLNRADEFVSYDNGRLYCLLGPGVPIEYMNISSANGSLLNFYENIIDTDLGCGYILQPKSGFRHLFNQRFHCLNPSITVLFK